MDEINRRFKRLYKLNCWHRADYESNAMWHLYAEQSKGVAICSTPDRMRAAIAPFRLKADMGNRRSVGCASEICRSAASPAEIPGE